MRKITDIDRYSRQTAFSGIGAEGQKRLLSSTVVIVGQGALGTASSSFLTRAGVGRLILIDDDRVELSNLQRQTLYEQADVGRLKAECAKEHLERINSDVSIEAVCKRLTDGNADALLGEADVVVDATDNFPARECINLWCVRHGTPWIYGGVAGSEGMTMNILPGGPCFKCLMPGEAPKKEDCADASTRGIISTLPSFIASVQCTEAMKILARGADDPAVRRTLVYADLFRNFYEQHEIKALPGCPVCGRKGDL